MANYMVINQKKLSNLLQDFFKVTGIRISFWQPDGKRAIACSEKVDSGFCTMIKQNQELSIHCNDCDQKAIQAAKESGEAQVFCCHAGLEEYIYPVIQSENLLGFLMIGQTRLQEISEETIRITLKSFKEYGMDPDALFAAYQELPLVNRGIMLSTANMIRAIACYTYLNGLVRLIEPPLMSQVTQYIDEHLDERITLDSIARRLHVSRSKLCHEIRKTKDKSIMQLVNQKRIDAVKRLLQQGMSVGSASDSCGFSSVSYCSKVFKKFEGVSPAVYIRDYNALKR